MLKSPFTASIEEREECYFFVLSQTRQDNLQESNEEILFRKSRVQLEPNKEYYYSSCGCLESPLKYCKCFNMKDEFQLKHISQSY
jgi:hypothetical protein